jgi:hypothetical protein
MNGAGLCNAFGTSSESVTSQVQRLLGKVVLTTHSLLLVEGRVQAVKPETSDRFLGLSAR